MKQENRLPLNNTNSGFMVNKAGGTFLNKTTIITPPTKPPANFIHGQTALLNEARKKTYALNLSQRIIHKNSFVASTISGERQIGKSMYALIVLYDIYKDWDIVLDHVFYKIDDFVKYLMESQKTGLRTLVECVDDAGVHFGSNQWNINRRGSILMSQLFDTVGTVTKSIIFTLPNSGNLLKNIRISEAMVNVRVTQGRHKYDREAHGYLSSTSPMEQLNVSKLFIDRFDVRIPDHVYERYAEKRKSYAKETTEAMLDYLSGEKDGTFTKNGARYTRLDIEDDE